MKKIFRKISIALCAVVIAGSIAPFSSCSEKRALASIAKTRAKGISFYAVHDWDFTSVEGGSVVEDRTSDFIKCVYSFRDNAFSLDGYRMTKGANAAVQEGKSYEGNFVFQRGDKRYLTDTLLLDEVEKSWTEEDVLYEIPVFGVESLSSWFNGVSAFSVSSDYTSPDNFLSSLKKVQSLAKALQRANLGSYRRTDGGYCYEMDLYSLFSSLLQKQADFISSLTAESTVGEMLTGEYFSDYFETFYGEYSSKDFLEEFYRLIGVSRASVFGKLTPTERFAAALEKFPAGEEKESVKDYIARLLQTPLLDDFCLFDCTLSDLFSDEALTKTQTLRERLEKEFYDPFSERITSRYTGFDESSVCLAFDSFGRFFGLDWYKKKSSDFAGLYTTTNEYTLRIRFLTSYPRLLDLTPCKVRKIDDVATERN